MKSLRSWFSFEGRFISGLRVEKTYFDQEQEYEQEVRNCTTTQSTSLETRTSFRSPQHSPGVFDNWTSTERPNKPSRGAVLPTHSKTLLLNRNRKTQRKLSLDPLIKRLRLRYVWSSALSSKTRCSQATLGPHTSIYYGLRILVRDLLKRLLNERTRGRKGGGVSILAVRDVLDRLGSIGRGHSGRSYSKPEFPRGFGYLEGSATPVKR